MKNTSLFLLIILLFSLSSCNPSTAIPSLLPTNTLTATSSPSPTSKPTSTPNLFTISFFTFHEFNGDGIRQEDIEPVLSSIKLEMAGKSCLSNSEGICELNSIPEGEYVIKITDTRAIDSERLMRYLLPSIASVISMKKGLDIVVNGNLQIYIPLAQGFLTVPFISTTPYELFSYYDLDPTEKVRNYAGSTIVTQGNISISHTNGTAPNHNGIDYLLWEGESIIASAPGIVIELGDNFFENCKTMLMVRILHPDVVVSQYAHLSSISVILDQQVNRGDLIGLSGNSGECSSGPHLHFGLAPDIDSLIFNGSIDFYFDEILRYGSPGYWTELNIPHFYK